MRNLMKNIPKQLQLDDFNPVALRIAFLCGYKIFSAAV